MREWERKDQSSVGVQIDLLSAVTLGLLIVCMVSGQVLIFILTGMIVTFIVLGKYWDQYMGKLLELDNPVKTIRLFEGEDTDISFILHNHSKLSIINGTLSLQMSESMSCQSHKVGRTTGTAAYQIPFSIPGKNTASVSFPCRAVSRGIGRINKIDYKFPLFRMHHALLNYRKKYQTMLIIYPKPLEVYGLGSFMNQVIGNNYAANSPYEDLQSVRSIRDYLPTDDFRHIHWNASVKKGALQTKVFERMQDTTISIVINISESSRLGNYYFTPRLEKLLSHAAFIAYYAAEQGFPVEVHLNLKRANRYHVRSYSSGTAQEDLKEALELLAHINNQGKILPFSELLYSLSKDRNQKVSILLGDCENESTKEQVFRWSADNENLYRVWEEEEVAVLLPFGQKGGRI
ncbi:DUF58 domain-containing protein [Halobacillus rhizosphaerae]|uniref:DUF58 domain-containing protein n=1 Tax=Halobacillus rhizosphaerae TaxID=3064889 RepID=UPI00398B5A68